MIAAQFSRLGSRGLPTAHLGGTGPRRQPALPRPFASGLEKHWNAVTASLTLTWSSGAVEGTVNKIKLLKRQTYGRASLALLRKGTMLT